MKLISLLSIIFTAAVATAAFDTDQPKIIDARPSKVYVPNGFDSNDQVQVVTEGYFPNGCYRPGDVSVSVDHSAKEIAIKTKAYEYPGFCIQVVVSYSQVVNVGLLEEGNYRIVLGSDQSFLNQVTVKKASVPSADDYIYAPVNQALLSKVNGEATLILTGTFTNSCMSLQEVKINVDSDTIVVQPIVEMANENCVEGNFPFRYNRYVGKDIKPGRYLLHVRSMNGRAINNLIDIN